MSEQIRSFIAFDIANDTVLSRISSTQTLLKDLNLDLKIVDPKYIHVTISFLGRVIPTIVDKVYETMKSIKFELFRFTLWIRCISKLKLSTSSLDRNNARCRTVKEHF
jgi:2'-5' RNA ligase